MNNVRKTILGVFLSIVIIYTLIHTVSAQENNTNKTIPKESGIVTLPNATFSELPQEGDVSKEEIILEAQRSLDRSLSILNTVVQAGGVLLTFIAIIATVAVGLGIISYSNLKNIIKDAENDGKIVKEHRSNIEKIENEANILRNGLRETYLKIRDLDIQDHEEPSSEIIGKLDQLEYRLDLLEFSGLSLNPEDYYNRAGVLFLKKNYELALRTVEKAIEIEPNQFRFWKSKGIFLNKLGRNDDAIWAFGKAIELQPDEDEAWYNRACTYLIKGNIENALSDLKISIELEKKILRNELRTNKKTNKERAQTDKCFEKLWDNKDFKKLVE